MKNNDICVTRNQKTICLPDKDFVFKPNITLKKYNSAVKKDKIKKEKAAICYSPLF